MEKDPKVSEYHRKYGNKEGREYIQELLTNENSLTSGLLGVLERQLDK